MSKRVVVCCDGTWNVPDERRAGVAAPTNVAKLACGLLTGGSSDQVLFYEPGVGTSAHERIAGGGFGYGLSRNIEKPYRFLALNYEPGDDLYLFGFSRGAFTARSLAGLIRNCGILRRENVDEVDSAFDLYRDRTSQTHPSALASKIFREMYAHGDEDIHFIGVWDTVGALGIPNTLPGESLAFDRGRLAEQEWGFHDTQLSSHVRFAYHALAIDETREPFQPTLWTVDPNAAGQTLEQVWFSGVHTEVGGGSRDASLSDIALLWMVDRAKATGLVFRPGCLEPGADDGAGATVSPNFRGEIVDSRKGPWKALHAYHRLTQSSVRSAPQQSLASSALRRSEERVGGYDPPGLDYYLQGAGRPVVTQVPEESGPPALQS